MPTYQYACTDCGHRFEEVQSFSDPSLTVCPECGGKLRKVYGSVGVVFKGSGFYRNDSRSGTGKTKSESSTTGESSTSTATTAASSDKAAPAAAKTSDSSSSSSSTSSSTPSSSSSSSSGSKGASKAAAG